MSHMTDMEELLSTIPSKPIREYMREAMSCYMANAYRGCIVLTYIALFDDLLEKLSELGKVNALAKTISDEASKKKSDQEVFENYLITKLASSSLIPALDAAFLDVLRILRNKSAHPSGHQPSPEEARFIFFEAISRVLSKPIFSTTQLVEQILARLSNANFFPTLQILDIANVVKGEIETLHEAAIPQLIARVLAFTTSPDPTITKNSRLLLAGLARLDVLHVNEQLKIKVIVAKCDDPNFSALVLQLLTSNGKLISGVNAVSLQRISQLISHAITNLAPAVSETSFTHPVSVFKSLVGHMTEADFIAAFGDELKRLIDIRPYSSNVAALALSRPLTFQVFLGILISKAGHNDFGTANSFASSIDTIDATVGTVVTEANAMTLIASVAKAADTGAWAARDVRTSKFASAPQLREKARNYVLAHPADATNILHSCNVFTAAADFFDQHLVDPPPAVEI